jgi:hypothetical protein
MQEYQAVVNEAIEYAKENSSDSSEQVAFGAQVSSCDLVYFVLHNLQR